MGRVLQGEAGDPNTCRRCGGTTFEMERKVSKSSAWHTKCFSCKKCNKPFLSLHYVYEAEDGEIYCKTCFSKSFPESETPLVYSDTTKISSESEETACPRCGGAVFSAEQIEIKGRLYHKKCLSCGKCSRPISIDLLAIGPDGDIYCNICCKSLNWPGQYEVPWDTSIIQVRQLSPLLSLTLLPGRGRRQRDVLQVQREGLRGREDDRQAWPLPQAVLHLPQV